MAQPLSFDESTMSAGFIDMVNNTENSTLIISPDISKPELIGDYAFMFFICLLDYPTAPCQTFTSLFTVLPPPPCPISSFTMIDLSPMYD